MGFSLDLSGKSFEEIDKPKFPVEGWYKATVDDYATDNDTGAEVVTFKISEGPFAGCTTKLFIYNPDYSDDREKATEHAARMLKRLGLMTDADMGKPDFTPDYAALVGKEFVLELKLKDSGFANIAFNNGVYPLDHYRIPAKVRKEMGLPPAVGAPPQRNPRTTTGAGAGSHAGATNGANAGAAAGERRINTDDL